MKIVCFDTETTGLDVQKEHIIQLSLVKVETDNWEVLDQRDWYILPEGDFSIPAEAEAVHHISKDFLLEHGVGLRSVHDELLSFTAGCDMLSYNGNGYDAPILHYNLNRLGLDFPFEGRTWYDALLLERIHTEGMTDPGTGEKVHNNLTAAYTRYYGHPFEGAHNSLDDVLATIEVFKAQVAAHGWEWTRRDEFGFISFDRWLVKRGDYYYLNQGAHRGESIESMMRIDQSYLDWITDKCKWTDEQTRQIILDRGQKTMYNVQCTRDNVQEKRDEGNSPVLTPSRGKKRSKGSITEADLSLF